jgi:hypothetical protein
MIALTYQVSCQFEWHTNGGFLGVGGIGICLNFRQMPDSWAADFYFAAFFVPPLKAASLAFA